MNTIRTRLTDYADNHSPHIDAALLIAAALFSVLAGARFLGTHQPTLGTIGIITGILAATTGILGFLARRHARYNPVLRTPEEIRALLLAEQEAHQAWMTQWENDDPESYHRYMDARRARQGVAS